MGYDIPADHHGSLPRAGREPVREMRPLPLTFNFLHGTNINRANRWHNGDFREWSALEWAGCMTGEAGEAANAAKKLKRIEGKIASVNEEGRHLATMSDAQGKVCKEVADTIIYGLLLMARVGCDDPEAVIRQVFNSKSVEYGFPERI